MDDDKRKTLEILVQLAVVADPVGCYDGARAERLLRSQSSREELSSIGVSAEILDHLFPANERE